MRVGIIISVAIVLLFVIFFVVSSIHNPDPPTDATAPAKLAKVTAPEGMPSLYTPEDPSASAEEAYKAVLALYKQNQAKYQDENPNTAMSEKLISKMVDAMNSGHIDDRFMDEQLPLKPGAVPACEDALEVIPRVVINRAQKIWDNGDETRSVEAARSVFALGERLWFHSTRLYNRLQGLQMMVSSLEKLYDWKDHIDDLQDKTASAADTDKTAKPSKEPAGPKTKVDPWVKFVKSTLDLWDPKIKLIQSVKPQVGDLLNIAANDKDRTFRIEATLRIGVRKFNPENKGNEVAMADLLEKLQKDPDDVIAEAAKVASEFTEAEMKRLN